MVLVYNIDLKSATVSNSHMQNPNMPSDSMSHDQKTQISDSDPKWPPGRIPEGSSISEPSGRTQNVIAPIDSSGRNTPYSIIKSKHFLFYLDNNPFTAILTHNTHMHFRGGSPKIFNSTQTTPYQVTIFASPGFSISLSILQQV